MILPASIVRVYDIIITQILQTKAWLITRRILNILCSLA